MLNVKTETSLWMLERVRFTQSIPCSLQTSFLSFDLCPGLARQNLAELHLIDVLRDVYGVRLGSAIEYIRRALIPLADVDELRVETRALAERSARKGGGWLAIESQPAV